MGGVVAWIFVLTLGLGLFAHGRLVNVSPLEPQVPPGKLALTWFVVAGLLPLLFSSHPGSLPFNASLSLAISTVYTPTALGKLDRQLGSIRDFIFLAATRALFAAVLAGMMTFLRWEGSEFMPHPWFIVVAGVSTALLLSRGPMWMQLGGDPRVLRKGQVGAFVVTACLLVLVNESRLTTETWSSFIAVLRNG